MLPGSSKFHLFIYYRTTLQMNSVQEKVNTYPISLKICSILNYFLCKGLKSICSGTNPYLFLIQSGTVTYADNDKIKTGPGAGEVSPEAECDPLEDHLDGEQNGEDHVHDL